MSESYLLMKLSDNDNFVIGKLVSETDGEVILDYPIVIRLTPNPMGTTSVSTTKMMPFSMNNKVAVMKSKIVSMSKPNEKVIGYYRNFVEKYGEMYDSVLEDDILGIKHEASDSKEEADNEVEDNVVTFKIPSGNTVH